MTLKFTLSDLSHALGFFAACRRFDARRGDRAGETYDRGCLSIASHNVRAILRNEPDLRPVAAEAIRRGIKNARATFP